jgi:hypothetical protein
MSDKFLPTQTLLYVSVRHIFISLTGCKGISDSMILLYKTSLLTASYVSFLEVYIELIQEIDKKSTKLFPLKVAHGVINICFALGNVTDSQL